MLNNKYLIDSLTHSEYFSKHLWWARSKIFHGPLLSGSIYISSRARGSKPVMDSTARDEFCEGRAADTIKVSEVDYVMG